MKYKLIKRNKVYEGRVFTTIVDEVEYLNGDPTIREVAEHPGGSVILAAFPDNHILLINQHRYPLDKFIWELPAGKLNRDEDPLNCAKRELEEETGYLADGWKKLTSIYTTPGFCNELLHIYIATKLKEAPGGRKLEAGEATMTMKKVPLQEAIAMIERLEIVDSKTICGIMIGERILKSKNTHNP
jgi:ADP-ribose pyrophosphatase